MATQIRSIPILYDNNAKKFIIQANKNLSMKGIIDFSEQVKLTNKILKKAGINNS
jgi:hypothetical protein